MAIVVGIAAMPAYIAYFDHDAALGAWLTVISVLSWTALFDFGLINGLRNSLVRSLHQDDLELSRKLVSSTYALMGIPAAGMTVTAVILLYVVQWEEFFGMDVPGARAGLRLAMLLVVIGIVLQFWLKTINGPLYAMEKNVFVSAIPLAGSLVILLYLIACLVFEFGSNRELSVGAVILLASTTALGTAGSYFIGSVIYFRGAGRNLRPATSAIHLESARGVSTLGSKFFIIQLSLLIVNSSDAVLIALLRNASEVVPFQIYSRLFTLVGTFFVLVTQPTWSAIAVAMERGEWVQIARISRALGWAALVGVLGLLALVPLSGIIIKVWVGDTVVPDMLSACVFAIVASLELVLFSSTCVANGLGRLRTQLIAVTAGAVLKLVIVWPLTVVVDHWTAIVMSHGIGLLPLVLVQPIVNSVQIKRSLRERNP